MIVDFQSTKCFVFSTSLEERNFSAIGTLIFYFKLWQLNEYFSVWNAGDSRPCRSGIRSEEFIFIGSNNLLCKEIQEAKPF